MQTFLISWTTYPPTSPKSVCGHCSNPAPFNVEAHGCWAGLCSARCMVQHWRVPGCNNFHRLISARLVGGKVFGNWYCEVPHHSYLIWWWRPPDGKAQTLKSKGNRWFGVGRKAWNILDGSRFRLRLTSRWESEPLKHPKGKSRILGRRRAWSTLDCSRRQAERQTDRQAGRQAGRKRERCLSAWPGRGVLVVVTIT